MSVGCVCVNPTLLHPTSAIGRGLASPVSVCVNLCVNLGSQHEVEKQDPVGKVNVLVTKSAAQTNAVAAVDHSREGPELDLTIGAHAGCIRDAEPTES